MFKEIFFLTRFNKKQEIEEISEICIKIANNLNGHQIWVQYKSRKNNDLFLSVNLLKKIQRMKGTSYGVLNWKSSKLKYQTWSHAQYHEPYGHCGLRSRSATRQTKVALTILSYLVQPCISHDIRSSDSWNLVDVPYRRHGYFRGLEHG